MAFKYSPMKPASRSSTTKPRKKQVKKPAGIKKPKKFSTG